MDPSSPRREPPASIGDEARVTVVCLCAAWCDTCNQFRAAFDAIALMRPAVRFVWLDIEDRADECGDVDVENFPTLLIARGSVVLHFGVSLPHQAGVLRLVDEMVTRSTGAEGVPDAVRAINARLSSSGG